MRHIVCSLLAALGLWVVPASGQDVFSKLAAYKYGDPGNAPAEVFKLINAAKPDQMGPLEEGLIVVISSGSATLEAKALSCRMLLLAGSDKSVPALAALLPDENLSSYARLPLERINSAASREALRKALPVVPGPVKAGIIISLAACKDEAAVPLLAPLALALDPVAIQALGEIGGESAAAALLKVSPSSGLQRAYDAALVSCAARVGEKTAVRLLEKVLGGTDSFSRAAALPGYAKANPAKARELAIAWLKQGEKTTAAAALTLLASGTADGSLVETAAAKLPEFSPSVKSAVIIALGAHGDRRYLKTVEAFLMDPDKAIATAAIEASGKLGNAQTVDLLLPIANPAVIDALVRMKEAEPRLIAALADPAKRENAAKALSARRSMASVPVFLKAAAGNDPAFRVIAWNSLKAIAPGEQIAELWRLYQAITDSKEKGLALAALRSTCSKAEDPVATFKTMAGFYPEAPESAKMFILNLAAISGTPVALELAVSALNSGVPQLRSHAIQSLMSWSNPTAASTLLELARNAPTDSERILGLRGYIRAAGLAELGEEERKARKKFADQWELTPEKRAAMFAEASKLATRREEKLLILGEIRSAHTHLVFPLLDQYLADEGLRNEAELAAVDVVEKIRKKETPEVQKMAQLLSTSQNATVANKAKRFLIQERS